MRLMFLLFITTSCIRTVNYTLPEMPIPESRGLMPATLDTICSTSGVQYVATATGLALDFDKNGDFILCENIHQDNDSH